MIFGSCYKFYCCYYYFSEILVNFLFYFERSFYACVSVCVLVISTKLLTCVLLGFVVLGLHVFTFSPVFIAIPVLF